MAVGEGQRTPRQPAKSREPDQAEGLSLSKEVHDQGPASGLLHEALQAVIKVARGCSLPFGGTTWCFLSSFQVSK